MFIQFDLYNKDNLFEQLAVGTEFEHITDGRVGAVVADFKDNFIPLVRTTTKYEKPTQKFTNLHYELVERIKRFSAKPDLKLNNALIEIYDDNYRKMGFHSDQALDLEDDSYIAVYSCYKNPMKSAVNPRKLVVKKKVPKGESSKCFKIDMHHDTVILFSTKTNREHLHKIVLEGNKFDENKWLGMTFRLSKTFVQNIIMKEHEPLCSYSCISTTNKGVYRGALYFTQATEREAHEFYKLRSKENKTVDFEYPLITYTISPSDLIPISNKYENDSSHGCECDDYY